MSTEEFAPFTLEELGSEGVTALPAKEVMSILDLAADIDLAIDGAAPIDLAVALNANIMAPIEAAVSANLLSNDSTSQGMARPDCGGQPPHVRRRDRDRYPGQPHGGGGAARDGWLAHLRAYQRAVDPWTREVEPRLHPQARGHDAAHRCRIAALSWAWLPPGNYRPIAPGDKGLLTQVLPSAHHPDDVTAAARVPPQAAPVGVGASADHRLASRAPLQATFPEGRALPSRSHPLLSIVLVPREGAHGQSQPSEQPWVFPFDKPLPLDRGTTRPRRTTPPTTRDL